MTRQSFEQLAMLTCLPDAPVRNFESGRACASHSSSMNAFLDIVRQYWLNAIALIAFAFAAARYIHIADWEGRLIQVLLAFGGMVMVVASDEFADWTGRYGWTRNQWLQYPGWFVKLVGIILLGWMLIKLYQ
jgi:hypothetical protein